MPLTSDPKSSVNSAFSDPSLLFAGVDSEASLQEEFGQGDILMLLSPGGLNRLFAVRARSAGYPIITNGIKSHAPGQKVLVAARDSYSELAEAIIGLVDDDTYYQSFGSDQDNG